MPRSPKKAQKYPSKSSRSKLKPSSSSNDDHSTTPLSDISHIINNPPPTTPRVIDFTLALPETDNVEGEGWSSDDSFEEKITWSRHRMRVTPGGFTPRNIQEVRRRLNLEQLPEDRPSQTVIKPICTKNRATTKRPSTPIKSFMAKDPSILPPTPSPKKSIIQTPSRTSIAKTPMKPAKEGSKGPMILATQGASKIVKPTNPVRQITHVKEFKFASDTQSRRSPTKAAENKSRPVSKDVEGQDVEVKDDSGETMEDVRIKAREIGMASILAWGETRGRYLDE